MAWKKSSEELVSAFYDALPEDELVEKRKMFGYPCAFVNGNMFTGLHEENMIVRLPEPERSEMMEKHHADLFRPFPDRVMKEYIAVPISILESPAALKELVLKGFSYAFDLPPKQKKKKK